MGVSMDGRALRAAYLAEASRRISEYRTTYYLMLIQLSLPATMFWYRLGTLAGITSFIGLLCFYEYICRLSNKRQRWLKMSLFNYWYLFPVKYQVHDRFTDDDITLINSNKNLAIAHPNVAIARTERDLMILKLSLSYL